MRIHFALHFSQLPENRPIGGMYAMFLLIHTYVWIYAKVVGLVDDASHYSPSLWGTCTISFLLKITFWAYFFPCCCSLLAITTGINNNNMENYFILFVYRHIVTRMFMNLNWSHVINVLREWKDMVG